MAGFRASLRWKVTDFDEGKGGIDIDEWILAIGRGATGDGMSKLIVLINCSPDMEAFVTLRWFKKRYYRGDSCAEEDCQGFRTCLCSRLLKGDRRDHWGHR